MPTKGFRVVTVRDADYEYIKEVQQKLEKEWIRAKKQNPSLKRPSLTDVISLIIVKEKSR